MHAVDGRVFEYDEPIKVAELMLEFPNHFLVDSSSLQSGQRIFPLPADDVLRVSHAYILLPMHKFQARLSEEELDLIAAFFSNNSLNGKRPKRGRGKVMPWRSDLMHGKGSKGEDLGSSELLRRSYSWPVFDIVQQQQQDAEVPIINNRQLMRSWTPKLETISECSLLKV